MNPTKSNPVLLTTNSKLRSTPKPISRSSLYKAAIREICFSLQCVFCQDLARQSSILPCGCILCNKCSILPVPPPQYCSHGSNMVSVSQCNQLNSVFFSLDSLFSQLSHISSQNNSTDSTPRASPIRTRLTPVHSPPSSPFSLTSVISHFKKQPPSQGQPPNSS